MPERFEIDDSAGIQRLRDLTCAKWTWHPDDVLPAWVADMDFAPVPAAVDAVRALVDRGDFGYNFAAASQLPEAFVSWQAARHGWAPDVEDVRVLCDVMQAVETALWLRTAPGDGVVLFTPVYSPFFSAIKDNGRRVVDCPLDPDGWRLDPEVLESVLDDSTSAILLCNPHNPTGRVFDRFELEAVRDVAKDRDLIVISDEIWADLVHPGSKHVPFAAIDDDAAARTVTVTAASKAFNLAGLRCAVAHIGDERTQEAIKGLPSHLLGAVGSPGAEATLAAWTLGEPWLAAVRERLVSNRDHVVARLTAELPGAAISSPEATYLAWIDCRGFGLDEDPAALLLREAKLAVSSGPDFGEEGAGFVRLNFATSRRLLDDILDRMVRTLGR